MNIKDLYRKRNKIPGIKGKLLRSGIWWWKNIVPPHPHPGIALRERHFNKYLNGRGDILLLGENTPPHKFNFGPNKITQVDLKPLEFVDIVVDAEEMSQHLTQQYDYVASCSMLEHTPHPWKVIEQIHAVLKPGGIVYISIPWLYPLHGEPHDYYRFSLAALKTLIKDNGFEELESGSEHSPHAALYRFLQAYFSEVLSFNNDYAYQLLLYFFTWILYPLGLVERFFCLGARSFYRADSQLYIVGRKR